MTLFFKTEIEGFCLETFTLSICIDAIRTWKTISQAGELSTCKEILIRGYFQATDRTSIHILRCQVIGTILSILCSSESLSWQFGLFNVVCEHHGKYNIVLCLISSQCIKCLPQIDVGRDCIVIYHV